MNKRDKAKLEKETTKMNNNSRNRMKIVRGMPHKALKILDIKDESLELPPLPKPRKKRELQWRKHKHTNISWLKNKRVKIVENTKKKEYTISGLNKSELSKVTEALR